VATDNVDQLEFKAPAAESFVSSVNIAPTPTVPKLLKNLNETFTLKDDKAIQFTIQNSLVQTVKELATFTVDDAQGLIDSIAPGVAGNNDPKDHIRFLGANKWGVEDLPGLGDGDFNDLIISATFTPINVI
jgi:hypothetical protein